MHVGTRIVGSVCVNVKVKIPETCMCERSQAYFTQTAKRIFVQNNTIHIAQVVKRSLLVR